MRLGHVATYGSVGTILAGVSVAATGALDAGTVFAGLGVLGIAGRAYVAGALRGGGGRAA